MFFKHLASKNQLPGSDISGTLVGNELNKKYGDCICSAVNYLFLGFLGCTKSLKMIL